MTDPAVYVASRVSDLAEPYVPSERVPCARCGFQVWVDPLRFVPIKASETVSVLCVPCALEQGALS